MKKEKPPDLKGLKIPSTWSYSAYAVYKDCAFKYFRDRVLRIRQPEGPALARGNAIHKEGELYLKGQTLKVPPTYKKFEHELKGIRAAKAKPEAPWGLTKDWKPVDFWSGWLKLKLDALIHDKKGHEVTQVDFKTGRIYATHEVQSDIYAAASPAYFPKMRKVINEFWYLDQGGLGHSPFTYTLKEALALQKDWSKRAAAMLADREFKKTPSEDGCRYCPHRTDKGGPCDRWKEV